MPLTVKRLLSCVIALWIVVLCIERSMEPIGADPSRTDVGIRLGAKSAIKHWSEELKSARAAGDHDKIQQATYELALANWQLLRFEDASAVLLPLLSKPNKTNGYCAQTLQAAAGLKRDAGKFDEASRLYNQALESDHAAGRAASNQAARDLNNLGVVALIDSMTKPDQATSAKALDSSRQYLERSLSTIEKDAAETLRTAVILNNLALVSEELGQSQDSATAALKAKRIRQDTAGTPAQQR